MMFSGGEKHTKGVGIIVRSQKDSKKPERILDRIRQSNFNEASSEAF